MTLPLCCPSTAPASPLASAVSSILLDFFPSDFVYLYGVCSGALPPRVLTDSHYNEFCLILLKGNNNFRVLCVNFHFCVRKIPTGLPLANKHSRCQWHAGQSQVSDPVVGWSSGCWSIAWLSPSYSHFTVQNTGAQRG